MYDGTITLFNRLHTREGDLWYPTVLRGVDLNMDKAAISAKYGAETQDKALLHVKYRRGGGGVSMSGKLWVPPKEWAAQENPERSITFAVGERFDFFLAGDWPDEAPIPDGTYRDGFFDHMSAVRDYVFTITSAARYSLIPHFEITGK